MTYKKMFYVISITTTGKRVKKQRSETVICTENEELAKELFEKADARKFDNQKIIMFSRYEG